MSEELFKEALLEACEKEFAPFETGKAHRFSRAHKRKIKAMCTEFSRRKARKLPLKKRLLIAMCAVIFAVTSGITAGAAVKGFVRKEQIDHTEVRLADMESSPKTIEYEYYLPEIPEHYVLDEKYSEKWFVHTSYIKFGTTRSMVLKQDIRENYKALLDNERHTLEDIDVNGHKGLYLGDEKSSVLIWDNGDYVLEISGDFDKDAMLKLARSLKKRDLQ